MDFGTIGPSAPIALYRLPSKVYPYSSGFTLEWTY